MRVGPTEWDVPPHVPWPLPTSRGHSEKMAICEPGSGSSLDTGPADAVILDFLVFREVRSKFLLFISRYNSWIVD